MGLASFTSIDNTHQVNLFEKVKVIMKDEWLNSSFLLKSLTTWIQLQESGQRVTICPCATKAREKNLWVQWQDEKGH